MLTIRLTRKGKKNQPFFKVVVIDKRRSSKGGRAVEDLGYVDPLKKRKSFKKERILYWISKGAKPSATVHNLLVSEKIIEGKKIRVFNISKKSAERLAKASQSGGPATMPASQALGAEAKPAPVTEIPVEEPKPEERPAQPSSSVSTEVSADKEVPAGEAENLPAVEIPAEKPAEEPKSEVEKSVEDPSAI